MAQQAMIRQVINTARERRGVPTTCAKRGKMARARVCLTATSRGRGSSANSMGITISTVTTMHTAQKEA